MTASTGTRRGLRAAVLVAVLAVAAAVVWLLAKSLGQSSTAKKPAAQQIQLVRPSTPPPPPPPPPKPPERPPEPPKVNEPVKVDTPRPVEQPKPAEAAPPPAPLGVDAAGSGSGDSFGLAANPGGRDLVQQPPQIGGTGGGAAVVRRAQYAFYRDVVVKHINEELGRVAELKATSGQLAVLAWIDRSGRIERVELRDASPAQTDLVRGALLSGRPLRTPPPETMPQPVWVLVNLRELG